MTFHLREARLADAAGIAQVSVQSWSETYVGLMPADFLARQTSQAALERRELMWRDLIRQGRDVVLVAEQGGALVAYVSAGSARDHPGYQAELMTLYSLKRVQGQGLGRALLARIMQEMTARGATNLALWVLATNPTRQWYTRQGAREAGEKTEGPLHEIRMVWDHLPEPAHP